MSVKVGGIWELGWNVPLSESYLWTFPLREFDVKEWAMYPVTGIVHNELYDGMVLTEYDQPMTMVNEFSEDFTRIFIDEKGTTPLAELKHPENSVYYFGRVGRSIMRECGRQEDLSVVVPTIRNTGVMWPHQILPVILYDRLMKS